MARKPAVKVAFPVTFGPRPEAERLILKKAVRKALKGHAPCLSKGTLGFGEWVEGRKVFNPLVVGIPASEQAKVYAWAKSAK